MKAKHIRLLGLGMLVALWMMASVGCRTAAPEAAVTEQRSGFKRALDSNLVTFAHRKADYSLDGKTWFPLNLHDELKAGRTFRTKEGSQIDFIVGKRGLMVTLKPDTILKLNEIKLHRTGNGTSTIARMTFVEGIIMGCMGPYSQDFSEIKTPKGNIALRMAKPGGSHIYTICACGMVSITGGEITITHDGKDYPVNAGEQFDLVKRMVGAKIDHHCPCVRESILLFHPTT